MGAGPLVVGLGNTQLGLDNRRSINPKIISYANTLEMYTISQLEIRLDLLSQLLNYLITR